MKSSGPSNVHPSRRRPRGSAVPSRSASSRRVSVRTLPSRWMWSSAFGRDRRSRMLSMVAARAA